MIAFGFLLVIVGNWEVTFWDSRNIDIWFRIAAYEGTTTAALLGVLTWRIIDRLSSTSDDNPFDNVLIKTVIVLTIGFILLDVVLNVAHPRPLPLPPVPKFPRYS